MLSARAPRLRQRVVDRGSRERVRELDERAGRRGRPARTIPLLDRVIQRLERILEAGQLDHRVQRRADAEHGGGLDQRRRRRSAHRSSSRRTSCAYDSRYRKRTRLVLPAARRPEAREAPPARTAGCRRVCSHRRPAASGVMATPSARPSSEMCDGSSGPTRQHAARRSGGELAPSLGERRRPRSRARPGRRAHGSRAAGERRTAAPAATRRRPGARRRRPRRTARPPASELISSSSSRPTATWRAGAQRVAAAAVGAEQLVGHRERHVGLGLVTARPQHPGRLQLGQEALDQRRLADAGLALHEQDLRAPGRRLGERIVAAPGARSAGRRTRTSQAIATRTNSYHRGIAGPPRLRLLEVAPGRVRREEHADEAADREHREEDRRRASGSRRPGSSAAAGSSRPGRSARRRT